MNVTQLKAFVMVLDCGSFSAAARDMGISQPAVTMQVQSLESALGVTLLDRGYRKIEPTEAGLALLPHARAVLAEIDDAHEDLARMADHVTGRLELAASTTPGQYVLPGLLGGFLRENPEVGVAISVADTSQVVDAVVSGEAALGITGAVVEGAKADFEPLWTDDVVIICPPGHRLCSAGSPIPIAEIVREPFVMREDGSGTRQVAEAALREAGADPGDLHVITELGTGEAIVSAVEGGLGLGIVSSWVAAKAVELGTVARLPAEGFPVSRSLYVVIPRATLSRAAEAFLAYLRESA